MHWPQRRGGLHSMENANEAQRHFWLHAVVGSALLLGGAAPSAAAEDTIKIGILHSLSGTMAISETILKDLMLMQVAELN
jgi:urea transport system substrate-binding protein